MQGDLASNWSNEQFQCGDMYLSSSSNLRMTKGSAKFCLELQKS